MPFKEILGQPRAVRVLQNALATGVLPHAYLFHGTKGTGRFTTARAFAMALLCGEMEGDACGRCPVCRRVEAEGHPDVRVLRPLSKGEKGEWVVDPERGEIRIEQVRDLQRWIEIGSFEGGWKIVLFDGAERMNTPAANALLKTLEEPPRRSLLVLISSTRRGLPSTIVSRCQPVHFAPLPAEEIEAFLSRRSMHAPEDRSLVAALSGGSLGTAVNMDEDWLLRERREWLRRLHGLSLSDAGESILDVADALSRSPRLLDVLDMLLGWYRDLLVYRARGNPPRPEVRNRDLLHEIEEVSGREAPGEWVDKYALVWKARQDVERRLNARMVVETLLLALADHRNVDAPRGAG